MIAEEGDLFAERERRSSEGHSAALKRVTQRRLDPAAQAPQIMPLRKGRFPTCTNCQENPRSMG